MKISDRVIYIHPDDRPHPDYDQRRGVVTGFTSDSHHVFVQLDGDDFSTCFAPFVIHPEPQENTHD